MSSIALKVVAYIVVVFATPWILVLGTMVLIPTIVLPGSLLVKNKLVTAAFFLLVDSAMGFALAYLIHVVCSLLSTPPSMIMLLLVLALVLNNDRKRISAAKSNRSLKLYGDNARPSHPSWEYASALGHFAGITLGANLFLMQKMVLI